MSYFYEVARNALPAAGDGEGKRGRTGSNGERSNLLSKQPTPAKVVEKPVPEDPGPEDDTLVRAKFKSTPYALHSLSVEQARAVLEEDLAFAKTRRTIRDFSSAPVDRLVIQRAIEIAATAPSGANRQPYFFTAISDPELKAKIREAAEEEERAFYDRRAPKAWLRALEPFGVDADKPHLTDAPWVIVVFRRDSEEIDGSSAKNYYPGQSTGIAVGFLLRALHRAGLGTLTHTPNPMSFVRDICGRPKSDKPFVIIPVGYPKDDCEVPDLPRKALNEIAEFR